ncbi:GNAT family N-acetyltransferase [Dictyobacter formicarum]|uniref:N-acetyltransferase n=1 Tax=Dictyobacter formicarum TaxID=2778368 RepID=A0ABQ3VR59_9CHLR|nr:GNAT family N-acetyltransferase [Dictyobacter formicarum]GHO88645.1 N-acetyltransferase [Dictyobacter formicarum]
MQKDVRTNFEEKVSYIARAVTGMTITDHSSFLAVDCGLPSDTFNVLVIRDMSARAELLATVDRFNAKGFPLAVWFWKNDVEDADLAEFTRHGPWHAETHVAMCADLSEIQALSLPITELEIKQAITASGLLQFGEAIAALFGDSDEGRQVLTYFQRLSEHSPGMFPAMLHYLGTFHGTVVATGTLFVGSETIGIYDIATHADYRRRGFGSAMFQYLLKEACTWNRRFCVLQASQEGLGIYEKAGFRAVGTVQTFENRGHGLAAL